jgi:hypothetical protein
MSDKLQFVVNVCERGLGRFGRLLTKKNDKLKHVGQGEIE